MKKRILSLLLVVAMVAAMIVVPVPVEVEAADAVPADKVAGNAIYDQTKKGTEFANKFADGGTVTATCPVCGAVDAVWTPYAATLNAATNNHDITYSEANYHYYFEDDVDADKRWQLTATTKDANVNHTVCLFLNGKNYTSADRTFIVNMSIRLNVMGDGVVTGKYTGKSRYAGALDNLGEANLYGGTWKRAEGSKYIIGGRGSENSFANNNVINIYKGTVIDGESRSESTALVCVTNYVDINMYGGEIKNGVSTGSVGGNIEFYCYGNSRHQSFNLYGGTVSGGADANGVSIYIDNANTSTTWTAGLNICGGAITGGSIYVPNDDQLTVTLSGSPTVSSLDLTDGAVADMTGLTSGASVGVTASQDTPFTTAFETADLATACAAYIDGGSYAVGVDEEAKKLYLYVDESVDLTVTQACPHCGGANADFEPWTFTGGTKYGETGAPASGHYYLLGSVSDSQYYIGASADAVDKLDVVLDLAGNDLGNTGGRAFYVYKSNSLSLMDSVGGGVVSGASTSGGGVIYTEGQSEYTEDTAAYLNLYEVIITSNAGAASGKSGGALYLSGDTYIKDSTINGAAYGTGGNNFGGAIFTRYGVLTMTNSTVNGATTKYGGGLCVNSGTANIEGCNFVGGASSTRGAALYFVAGTSTLTNCTITGAAVTERGGVAYVGGATVTFNNCTATGGSTSSTSNNYELTGHGVYANSESANVTINGGSFGTVYSVSSSLTLTGAPTITDLYVWTGLPANVSGMTGGNVTVTVLVSGETTTGHTSDTGAGVFTNTGLTNTTTLAGVFNSGIEGLIVQSTADNAMELAVQTFEWYCEACGTTVEWTELTDLPDDARCLLNESGDPSTTVHYYLSGDMSAGGVVTLGYANKTYHAGKWHIDLCGNTYASTGGRAFSLYQGSELAIQSSVAGGKVTAVGTGNGNGGVILTQAAKDIDDVEGNEISTVKLYDVTLQLTGNKKLGSGGVLYMAGSSVLYADGAIIDGSAKSNYTYTNSGNSANSAGGAIYGAALTSITLVDTTVKGGAAHNGGAIYQTGEASMSLDGCTIIGSHVTNNGGSLYKGAGLNNTLTINDTTISGGIADNNGGNVYTTGVLTTITGNSTVSGGIADNNGGNFYVTYNKDLVDENTGLVCPQGLNLNGTTVSGGTATGGGNMYIVSGAVLTMNGGTVSGGTAKQMDAEDSVYGRGGNIYMSNAGHTITGATITGGSSIVDASLAETSVLGGGNIYIMNSGVVTITGSTITDGSATTNGGNIYVYGSLNLDDSTVSGGTASVQGGDIYVNGSDFAIDGVENQLILGSAITADMGVGFSDDMFADGAPFIGKILRTNAANAALELTLDGNRGGAAVTVDAEGYLTVANGYGVIAQQDGSFDYYASSAAALAAYNPATDAYVKICENDVTLTLTQNTVIDLNGAENVTFSGAYTVSGFDSAADLDSHSGGIATLADGATATSGYGKAADGLRYITYVSSTGDTVKFHRAEMDITGVSLRPGTQVGIYYWAQWDLDNDLIANELVETGVVYCIDGMPADNFTDDTTKSFLYTVIDADDYTDRKEVTGGFMANILAENDATRYNSKNEVVNVTNQDAIEWVISATPYINLDNGVTLCADEGEGTAAYSLATLVQAVDGKIVENADTDKAWVAVNTFATTWLTAANGLENAIAFANYVAATSEETV